MRLIYANSESLEQDSLQAFGGRTHVEAVQWGNLYETQNLSNRLYPVLTNRLPRGVYREQALTSPHGLFYKDGLMWADGTSLYFNGEYVGACSDTDKVFCGMGAYIIIFPDKLIYSTEDGTLSNMENSWTGTVSFTTSSIVFPSGVTPSALGFDQYDGVKITGSQYDQNNTVPIIYEIRDNDYQLAETAGDDEKVNSFYCTPNIFKEESNVMVTIKREVPDLDYILECDNRIWGCKGHEIFASALGAPKCWNRFEGISTDSYTVNVGSEGVFTGCGVALGYVIFFKENCFHKIYGTKPSNFAAQASQLRGVASGSSRSVALVNEVLWYLSKDGMMAYGGSTPESIADAFGQVRYENAVSGGVGGKLYVSMQDAATDEWGMYVYDISSQFWMREDSTHALFFASSGRELYYIDAADKKIKTVSGDLNEQISWAAEFGDMTEGIISFKTIERLYLNLWLDEGATCTVWLRYQTDEDWKSQIIVTGDNRRRTKVVPIIPRRYTQFAIKLTGVGNFKLYGITRFLEAGTELSGGDKP